MAKNISMGSLTANKLFLGQDEVFKVYLGQFLVWENSSTQQLLPPTISLQNTILTIIDNNAGEIAESFNIYIDGVLETNVPA